MAAADIYAILVVAECHTSLGPIEQRRRYDFEAAVGIVVTDFPDVRIDAEDLVQNYKTSAIGSGWGRQVRAEPVAISRMQLCVSTLSRGDWPLILADHDSDAHSPQCSTKSTCFPRDRWL